MKNVFVIKILSLILILPLFAHGNTKSEKLEIFEARLRYLNDKYDSNFQKVFETSLNINKMWEMKSVVFQADLDSGGRPQVFIGGGALLLPHYTPDVFTLIVCHEIGHLIGGAPYKSDHHYSSSVEGQADYFAAKCAADVFLNNPSQWNEVVLSESVQKGIATYCQQRDSKSILDNVCIRTLSAAFRASSDGEVLPLDLVIDKEVEKTLNNRPSKSCQLKTFMAGVSDRARPKCWFNNSVVIPENPLNFEFPKLEAQAQGIWNFISNRLSLDSEIVAPEVFLLPFEKTQQGEKFNQWQRSWLMQNLAVWQDWAKFENENGKEVKVSKSWVRQNIDKIFPFPKTFLAFHYDGTNRIQMNPSRTMLSSYQNGPNGIKKDFLGAGFYSMGHEFLHYALQEKFDFPAQLHHCLFITELGSSKKSLVIELADFLVGEELSAPSMKKMGPNSEKQMAPCESLSEEDQLRVTTFAKTL